MSPDIYILGFFLTVIGVSWYCRHSIEYQILQRLFAWYINRYTFEANEMLRDEKTRVFRSVQEYRESINKDLTILDVGSGSAINLNFIPLNTNLVCLDPNPHYAGYIDGKLKKDSTLMKHVDFVQGYAEEMPFENETFDVVVCTLVLCSVKDIVKSLEEIKRVLKPGGNFVFAEHVLVDDKWSWTYMVQIVSTPMKWLFYGCYMARDTEYYLKRAGFSELSLNFIRRESAPMSFKRRVFGIGIK